MAGAEIRFEDGAAYERMMGVWSRLAGEIFLDWLAPPAGLRWIDVGCGSGAFSELIVERAANRQRVSAGARASPSWFDGRHRPTCGKYACTDLVRKTREATLRGVIRNSCPRS